VGCPDSRAQNVWDLQLVLRLFVACDWNVKFAPGPIPLRREIWGAATSRAMDWNGWSDFTLITVANTGEVGSLSYWQICGS